MFQQRCSALQRCCSMLQHGRRGARAAARKRVDGAARSEAPGVEDGSLHQPAPAAAESRSRFGEPAQPRLFGINATRVRMKAMADSARAIKLAQKVCTRTCLERVWLHALLCWANYSFLVQAEQRSSNVAEAVRYKRAAQGSGAAVDDRVRAFWKNRHRFLPASVCAADLGLSNVSNVETVRWVMHRVQHRDARCLKAVRVLDLHSLHWSRAGLDELCICLKMCPGVCSLNLGEMLACPPGGVDCVIRAIEQGLTGLAMGFIDSRFHSTAVARRFQVALRENRARMQRKSREMYRQHVLGSEEALQHAYALVPYRDPAQDIAVQRARQGCNRHAAWGQPMKSLQVWGHADYQRN